MFFKRSQKEKDEALRESPPSPPPLPTEVAAAPDAPAPSLLPLEPAELRRLTDPKTVDVRPAPAEPGAVLLGQERAFGALSLAVDMEAPPFIAFVSASAASGARQAVTAFLREKARLKSAPPDWVYVRDFSSKGAKALRLEAGQAHAFARLMTAAVEELRVTLPAAFQREHYRIGRRAIDEEFRAASDDALEGLKAKAQAQSVTILRTPTGFGLAPMHEGKAVRPEVYQQLPEKMRREVAQRIEAFDEELRTILTGVPATERGRRARLQELRDEIAGAAVSTAFAELDAAFRSAREAVAHIAAVKADIVRNAALFLPPGADEDDPPLPAVDALSPAPFDRYAVAVAASNDANAGAPVIEAATASPEALWGAGGSSPAGIAPGALHAANGGFLVLDAVRGASPGALAALGEALHNREIRLRPSGGSPPHAQPIPLDVKVFLIGVEDGRAATVATGRTLAGLVKIVAPFERFVTRSRDNEKAFGRLAVSIAEENGLPAPDAGGAARLAEEAARFAGHKDRLNVETGLIEDLLREAAFWAADAGRGAIGKDDVARAANERHRRRGDWRGDGAQPLSLKGETIGQALTVSATGFADRPFRLTRVNAGVSLGDGHASDIRRASAGGGDRGCVALWGYLAERFATQAPLSIAASIAFDEPADEDFGVPAAEFAASLSALSGSPIRQGVCLLGAAGQDGGLAPVASVNDRIELFFDMAQADGLTGGQGVIVPKANVANLMLRPEIVDAAKQSRFSVWAAATVGEAMQVLTGTPAGAKDAEGQYEAGSLNRLVDDKLRLFAERARAWDRGRIGADKDDDYHDRARRRGR